MIFKDCCSVEEPRWDDRSFQQLSGCCPSWESRELNSARDTTAKGFECGISTVSAFCIRHGKSFSPQGVWDWPLLLGPSCESVVGRLTAADPDEEQQPIWPPAAPVSGCWGEGWTLCFVQITSYWVQAQLGQNKFGHLWRGCCSPALNPHKEWET